MAAGKKSTRASAKRAPAKRASAKKSSASSKRASASSKQTSEKLDILDIGHKVWLAGLGAFSRAQAEGPRLFEALIEEGAVVHERTRDTTEQMFNKALAEVRSVTDERVGALRGKASETWDSVENIFQSRVQKALQQIGVPTSQEIRALTRKVDELTRSVEGLGTAQGRSRSSRAAQSSDESAHSAAV